MKYPMRFQEKILGTIYLLTQNENKKYPDSFIMNRDLLNCN